MYVGTNVHMDKGKTICPSPLRDGAKKYSDAINEAGASFLFYQSIWEIFSYQRLLYGFILNTTMIIYSKIQGVSLWEKQIKILS